MGAEYHSHPSGTTSKSQQSLHHPKLRSLCDSRYEAFDSIAKSLGLNSNQADKSVSNNAEFSSSVVGNPMMLIATATFTSSAGSTNQVFGRN
jgi:hypothetical protein